MSQKLNNSSRERVSHVADLCYKICYFLAVWVPSMSMEGSIRFGTNLDDEQTRFIII